MKNKENKTTTTTKVKTMDKDKIMLLRENRWNLRSSYEVKSARKEMTILMVSHKNGIN